MRKFFWTVLLAVMMSFQSFCGAAATIESSQLGGDKDIVYPIVHTGNADVDKKINHVIDGITQNFLMEIRTDIREHGINITHKNTNFSLMSNESVDNVLSIFLTQSKYGSNGPAHPTNYLRALNFDLSSGERLTTSDLAKFGYGDKDSLFKKLLTKLETLAAERKAKGMITVDVNAVKSLPENFYFDENAHLHFVFEQNTIAHYAAGVIDIDMDE